MTNPLYIIPFLAVLLVFLLLYSSGKKKYVAYVNALDKKEFGLADFFYVGFRAMELVKYQYGSTLDRKLRRELTELYSAEFCEFYLRVVWAQAVTSAVLGILLGSLFYAAMDGDTVYLLLGAGLAVILAWASFHDIDDKVAKRHNQVAIELPELTNQILILSGAGLTLKGAIDKIVQEMPSDGPLYQALGKTVEQMNLGATDEKAFDLLVSSCNMPEVRRFVSVILQNLNRGGTDVLNALREIGKELWDTRRAAAQRIAEETSTKLLFPMVLMLIAVILLVVAPAVMGMNIT